MLIADDDARPAAVGDTGQKVVRQGGGVLLVQGVGGEGADGWRDAVDLVPGLELREFHRFLITLAGLQLQELGRGARFLTNCVHYRCTLG
jgi:hypothetical protein